MLVIKCIFRSAASISGSTLAGILLSSQSWSPYKLMLYTAGLRVVPILGQLFIINIWGHSPIINNSLDSLNYDNVMFYLSVFSLCVGNLCAGLITTACFTTMMTISQSAPSSVQTSHYSLLATSEVLGKLLFASVAGVLIDMFGLELVFVVLVIFAVTTIPLVLRMPDLEIMRSKSDKE